MNRRSILVSVFGAASLMLPSAGWALGLPPVTVYRNPGCSCCEAWVKRMVASGFQVSIADDPNLDTRRASLNIPAELASCHIALADGYAFEGHVPPVDIVKFLSERPSGTIGLAVPRMPLGSPGMGPEGSGGPYEVLLITANAAPTLYARH